MEKQSFFVYFLHSLKKNVIFAPECIPPRQLVSPALMVETPIFVEEGIASNGRS